jgi:hypothetical protein
MLSKTPPLADIRKEVGHQPWLASLVQTLSTPGHDYDNVAASALAFRHYETLNAVAAVDAILSGGQAPAAQLAYVWARELNEDDLRALRHIAMAGVDEMHDMMDECVRGRHSSYEDLFIGREILEAFCVLFGGDVEGTLRTALAVVDARAERLAQHFPKQVRNELLWQSKIIDQAWWNKMAKHPD